MTSSNKYCQEIVNLMIEHGVRVAFCSPGSRNVPLLNALDSTEEISKKVVVDERSGAFQALGYSLVSREPVALICTSGSAVLNYAPAIAEAYYTGVPLIVISADRPREWIDQDDSQTIRQFEVLDHIVKGSYDVRAIPDEGNIYPKNVMWHINRTVNESLLKALEGKKGPVHINVQLDAPLGDTETYVDFPSRVVTMVKETEAVDASALRILANEAVSSRIMIVAGFGCPDHNMNAAVRQISTLPNVVVMAETLANIKGIPDDAQMIDSVLSVMSDREKEAMRPDIVISFGGALVSRMLKEYIRRFPPKKHWSIGYSNYFGDCFQSLTARVEITPYKFLKQLYHAVAKLRRDRQFQCGDCDLYGDDWKSVRHYALRKSEEFIAESPWSDLTVMDRILGFFSSENVFLSNGTPVRYAQLIGHTCHAEYCNRGVSGIDGCTATAVGGALAFSGQTVLISGDMSWLYDSGASTLASVPPSMKMIVIDNNGGAIFRFIKSTGCLPEEFKRRYLCMPDLPDVAAIAGAYGIETRSADSLRQIDGAMRWLLKNSEKPKMLYIRTPGETSADVLKSYFCRT